MDREKEWLLTNGLGSYSSGTVGGPNTRSYHGLLISSLNPPTDRYLLVADIEEEITVNRESIYLQGNSYVGNQNAEKSSYFKSFSASDFPTWTYSDDKNWNLEKTLFMPQGVNAILVRYKNSGNTNIILTLHPLYSYGDFMSTFKEDSKFAFLSKIEDYSIETYAMPEAKPIYTVWSAGEFTEIRTWYKDILLAEERDRGYGSVCDYYQLGTLQKSLEPGEELILAFSSEEYVDTNDLGNEIKKIIVQKQQKYKGRKPSFYKDLLLSSEQFLVDRNSTESKSIIAGYHWFADWGRDTMIAMRGLTIATGKQEISKSILKSYLESLNKGMLPNRFPDYSGDVVEYNTIDATLWLFISLYDYYLKFADDEFIELQLDKLKGILDQHLAGTRYNIHVTEEGFLYGGEDGVQLTWMDAKVDEEVITPRIGCPVEINALWYNALKIYEFFCKKCTKEFGVEYAKVVSKLEKNFVKMFSNSSGTLYDVIIPGKSEDNSFRPNQIFAVSLPFTMLNKKQQKKIFEATREKLYTFYGLRTLAMEDPSFEGVYFGDQQHRDQAYHQGTVWPFLLHEYFLAYIKIYGDGLKQRKTIFNELEQLRFHFYNDAGIQCISEIFDGLNPEKGKGCIQQAWSVGAILKLYIDFNLGEFED